MRRDKTIITLFLVILPYFMLRGQDVERLSQMDILGTARFVGMAGAMTSVGGDPSAVIMNNPAGLGVYRRFETMFSLDISIDRSQQVHSKMFGGSRCFPSQASINFHWNSDFGEKGHNLMVSYQRLKSWNRYYFGTGSSIYKGDNIPTPSLTRVLAQNAEGIMVDNFKENWEDNENIGWLTGAAYNDSLILLQDGSNSSYVPLPFDDEMISHSYNSEINGSFNQYSLTYGLSLNSRWFIGIGLNILSYSYRRNTQYRENFGEGGYMTLQQNLILSGAGVNGSIGIIGHPFQWLRIGASFQTPSTATIKTSQNGTMESRFSETQYYWWDYDVYGIKDIDFTLPLKSSVGVAFQFETSGLISLQYDFMHQKDMPNVHTIRIGGEYVINDNIFINAGYAFQSNFGDEYIYVANPTSIRMDVDFENTLFTQNACVGFGYRGKYFIGQLAYRFSWQKENLFAFESADPYPMRNRTSHIVLTIGLHL